MSEARAGAVEHLHQVNRWILDAAHSIGMGSNQVASLRMAGSALSEVIDILSREAARDRSAAQPAETAHDCLGVERGEAEAIRRHICAAIDWMDVEHYQRARGHLTEALAVTIEGKRVTAAEIKRNYREMMDEAKRQVEGIAKREWDDALVGVVCDLIGILAGDGRIQPFSRGQLVSLHLKAERLRLESRNRARKQGEVENPSESPNPAHQVDDPARERMNSRAKEDNGDQSSPSMGDEQRT